MLGYILIILFTNMGYARNVVYYMYRVPGSVDDSGKGTVGFVEVGQKGDEGYQREMLDIIFYKLIYYSLLIIK